ncbi:MAG: nuclear transport factor 2 family protein [Myxococcales bacterium]|nr:nuclear transport factor 2 family protein [Myxococcales bacterium]
MIGSLITRAIIRRGFDAMNRGDVDGLMRLWADDCTFFYPGRVEAGGRFAGKPAVTQWFTRFFTQFPRRRYTVREIGLARLFAMSGDNTVFVHFDLELTSRSGLEAKNGGVSMLRIAGGKAVSEEIFLRVIDGDEYKRGWGDIP